MKLGRREFGWKGVLLASDRRRDARAVGLLPPSPLVEADVRRLEVKAVPVSAMPESPVPTDWKRCRFATLRVRPAARSGKDRGAV